MSTSLCAPRGHRRHAGNLLCGFARARECRRLGKPGRARGACLRHARVAAHLVASLREGGHIADRAGPSWRSACGHRADVRVVEARRARPALRGPWPERPARPDLRAARRPGRRRCGRRGDRRDSVAAFRPARGARRRRPGLRRAERRLPALPRVQPRAALRGGDLGRIPRAARAQLPAAGAPLPAKARRARDRVVPPRRGSRSVAARSGHALPASSRTVGRRRRRPSCRRPRSIGNSRSWRCGNDGCDCGSSRSTGGPSRRSTASGSPAPSRRIKPGATRRLRQPAGRLSSCSPTRCARHLRTGCASIVCCAAARRTRSGSRPATPASRPMGSRAVPLRRPSSGQLWPLAADRSACGGFSTGYELRSLGPRPARCSRAGLPATITLAGTSRVTTAPAPISAPAPMRTPARMTVPEPIAAPRSIVVD